MASLKLTVSGAIIIVVGILALTALGPYVTVEVQDVKQRDLEPRVQFLVGDYADRPFTLPAGVTIFGTVSVAEAPSNKSGDIHFIVLDTENYQRWLSGAQAEFTYAAQQGGAFNYTFKTDKIGVYHFVFDNRDSVYKKYVTLSVTFNEVITSRVPDRRLAYAGWFLLVIGGIALVYGVLKKPQVRWS